MSALSRPGSGAPAAVALVALAARSDHQGDRPRPTSSPARRVDLFAGIDLVRVANERHRLRPARRRRLAASSSSPRSPSPSLLGFFLRSAERPGLWLPIGLLAGGAVGNLIDRVREGSVTDFIDLAGLARLQPRRRRDHGRRVILVGIYAVRPGAGASRAPSRTSRPAAGRAA